MEKFYVTLEQAKELAKFIKDTTGITVKPAIRGAKDNWLLVKVKTKSEAREVMNKLMLYRHDSFFGLTYPVFKNTIKPCFLVFQLNNQFYNEVKGLPEYDL